MKTLFYFSIGLIACIAEAREQYRVNRYEDDVAHGRANLRVCPIVMGSDGASPSRFRWLPSITPGWPLRGGKWVIKWEGTF